MDKQSDTKSWTFSRLNFPAEWTHLKPLSLYSKPLINFQIEIMNNCEKKQSEDSNPDDFYETPAKKRFRPDALSPDLGCFVDPFSPSAQSELKAPLASMSGEGRSDYDSMLGLDPSEIYSASNTHQYNPVLNPASAPESVEEHLELKKQQQPRVKDVEKDPGFFSMCHVNDVKAGDDPSQSANPEPPRASSSPPLEKSHPGGCRSRASPSEQRVSFTFADSDPIVGGSMLPPAEPLEANVDDVWNIGLPMFESSVCHSGGSAQPPEEVQRTVTPYKSPLPPKVQVKSVVVLPSKPAATPKQPSRAISSARSRRRVNLNQANMERDKQTYLHSVTKHLKETPGASPDFMSELQTLMNGVADQTAAAAANATEWQHPSDLTRRNYQRRFGNSTPTASLQEWKSKSSPRRERFAHVSNVFRSYFP